MNQESNNKNTFRAIIYTRVSSKEQVEGTSLDTQKESCISYCNQKGLEIDRIFVEEGESGKFIDRTQLQNLLEYCKNNKGKISHLVVKKLDRFSRNALDHMWIRKELLKIGITLKSVEEAIDDTPEGVLFENMIASINQYDNDVRASRCVDGMEKKLSEGIWCRRPPIGYKIPKKLGAKEKKILPDIPDDETYPYIKKAWEMYLTGNYSIAEVARKINSVSNGAVRLYPQKLQHILKNKFYSGIIVSPFSKQEYKGLHQPMITEREYSLVQHIMKGKGKKVISIKLINPDFPLRGLVRCGTCNKHYTASWSKSRNTIKHAYYHCFKKICSKFGKSIKKEEIESAFLDYLGNITPKKKFFDDFEKAVMKVWKRKFEEVNADYLRYEKQLEKLKQHRSGLIDMKAKNLLSDEEFKEEKERITKEIDLNELAMIGSKIEMFDLEATIEYAKQFISDLPRQWFDLGIENKIRFQKLIFPEGLPYLGNNKFGTAKLSVFFEINQQLQNQKTSLVGPIGFEPMTKRL